MVTSAGSFAAVSPTCCPATTPWRASQPARSSAAAASSPQGMRRSAKTRPPAAPRRSPCRRRNAGEVGRRDGIVRAVAAARTRGQGSGRRLEARRGYADAPPERAQTRSAPVGGQGATLSIVYSSPAPRCRDYRFRFHVLPGRAAGGTLAVMPRPAPTDPAAPPRWTTEQYLRLVDEGVLGPDDKVELLEGVIVAVPPSNARHASGIVRLSHALFGAV